ncbi:MAG TPA: hypothetical protein VHD32_01190 [Candidatus Didemnitutus sp.]|nr:hypothetical protein [Candidatus Didemnitutus sp.]
MNPTESTDLSPAILVALRNDPDAMRIITERLNVKDMGPADHIRTKHEVKAFVEAAGDAAAAEELLKRARERRQLNQNLTMKVTQQHGQRMGM